MDIPHFVYSLTSQQTYGLFLLFDCYDQWIAYFWNIFNSLHNPDRVVQYQEPIENITKLEEDKNAFIIYTLVLHRLESM